MKYNTKNKLIVINCLKEHSSSHLTIDQMGDILKERVPLASIYRIVDSLVEEGVVKKFVIDRNTPACFQYVGDGNEHSHFHMLCSKCGRLFHLECDEVNHLLEHIEKEHGFKVDISKVNLYGVCKDCQERNT